MSFAHPSYFYGLLLLLPLTYFLWKSELIYRQRLKLLVAAERWHYALQGPAKKLPWKSIGLQLISVSLLILALAQPRWGFQWKDVKKQGADVMIALDISRSMNATDVNPNRLQRAKREIRDLLQVAHGDRVGLLLFAGVGFVQCPLTYDKKALELFLEEAHSELIPIQGTSLTQAISLGMGALEQGGDAGAAGKAMILISDGEDQDSEPLEKADEAQEKGVVIHTVSLGKEGAPIPLPDGGFMKDESGQMVVTKPQTEILRAIAQKTSGQFLQLDAGLGGLEALYQQYIRPKLQEREQSQREKIWNEVQYLFVALAILVFWLDHLGLVLRQRSDESQSPKL